MTVRDFINSYLGEFRFITIFEFIGDIGDIGADLEEDYEEVGTYSNIMDIPRELSMRRIEYFDVKDNEIEIYLMVH